jgi:hypothetical protein
MSSLPISMANYVTPSVDIALALTGWAVESFLSELAAVQDMADLGGLHCWWKEIGVAASASWCLIAEGAEA